MAASRLSIINGALRYLRQSAVGGVDDNKYSQACEVAYDTVADSLFEAYGWRWARRHAELQSANKDSLVKEGWRIFNIPPTAKRVIAIWNRYSAEPIEYRITQDGIHARDTGGLAISYVERTAEEKYPADFALALSASLASQVAPNFAEFAEIYNALNTLYERALSRAKSHDTKNLGGNQKLFDTSLFTDASTGKGYEYVRENESGFVRDV